MPTVDLFPSSINLSLSSMEELEFATIPCTARTKKRMTCISMLIYEENFLLLMVSNGLQSYAIMQHTFFFKILAEDIPLCY
jgi:hypothetical protein